MNGQEEYIPLQSDMGGERYMTKQDSYDKRPGEQHPPLRLDTQNTENTLQDMEGKEFSVDGKDYKVKDGELWNKDIDESGQELLTGKVIDPDEIKRILDEYEQQNNKEAVINTLQGMEGKEFRSGAQSYIIENSTLYLLEAKPRDQKDQRNKVEITDSEEIQAILDGYTEVEISEVQSSVDQNLKKIGITLEKGVLISRSWTIEYPLEDNNVDIRSKLKGVPTTVVVENMAGTEEDKLLTFSYEDGTTESVFAKKITYAENKPEPDAESKSLPQQPPIDKSSANILRKRGFTLVQNDKGEYKIGAYTIPKDTTSIQVIEGEDKDGRKGITIKCFQGDTSIEDYFIGDVAAEDTNPQSVASATQPQVVQKPTEEIKQVEKPEKIPKNLLATTQALDEFFKQNKIIPKKEVHEESIDLDDSLLVYTGEENTVIPASVSYRIETPHNMEIRVTDNDTENPKLEIILYTEEGDEIDYAFYGFEGFITNLEADKIAESVKNKAEKFIDSIKKTLGGNIDITVANPPVNLEGVYTDIADQDFTQLPHSAPAGSQGYITSANGDRIYNNYQGGETTVSNGRGTTTVSAPVGSKVVIHANGGSFITAG